MYGFIFIYFYKLYKSKNEEGPRTQASFKTFLAQFGHIALAIAIMRGLLLKSSFGSFFLTNFGKFLQHKTTSIILLCFPWVLAIYLFYSKKRIDKLAIKYDDNLLNRKNKLLVLSLVILPWVIALSWTYFMSIKNN